jgi:hypothetical protein
MPRLIPPVVVAGRVTVRDVDLGRTLRKALLHTDGWHDMHLHARTRH